LRLDFVEYQPSADLSSSGSYSYATLSRVPLPNDKALHTSHSVPSQNSHAMYATPSSSVQSHARNDQAYSQTKSVVTPASAGPSTPRAGIPRQLLQEQNGQAAGEPT